MLGGKVIHHLVSATPLSFLNHLAGGFLGLFLMIIFISFVFNVVEIFDKDSVMLSNEVKDKSRFYHFIKGIIPTVFPGNLFNFKV